MALSNLGRKISLRSLISFVQLGIRAETKVTELGIVFVVKEDILRLQVSMRNAPSMHEGEGLGNLCREFSADLFIKRSASDEIKQVAVGTQLGSHITHGS